MSKDNDDLIEASEEIKKAQRGSKILTDAMKSKKFQVELDVFGKRKFAYLDDLTMLDDIVKQVGARVLSITDLTEEKD